MGFLCVCIFLVLCLSLLFPLGSDGGGFYNGNCWVFLKVEGCLNGGVKRPKQVGVTLRLIRLGSDDESKVHTFGFEGLECKLGT